MTLALSETKSFCVSPSCPLIVEEIVEMVQFLPTPVIEDVTLVCFSAFMRVARIVFRGCGFTQGYHLAQNNYRGHSVLRGLRWDIVAAGPTDVHNLFPDTMYLCHCSLEMLKTW